MAVSIILNNRNSEIRHYLYKNDKDNLKDIYDLLAHTDKSMYSSYKLSKSEIKIIQKTLISYLKNSNSKVFLKKNNLTLLIKYHGLFNSQEGNSNISDSLLQKLSLLISKLSDKHINSGYNLLIEKVLEENIHNNLNNDNNHFNNESSDDFIEIHDLNNRKKKLEHLQILSLENPSLEVLSKLENSDILITDNDDTSKNFLNIIINLINIEDVTQVSDVYDKYIESINYLLLESPPNMDNIIKNNFYYLLFENKINLAYKLLQALNNEQGNNLLTKSNEKQLSRAIEIVNDLGGNKGEYLKNFFTNLNTDQYLSLLDIIGKEDTKTQS